MTRVYFRNSFAKDDITIKTSSRLLLFYHAETIKRQTMAVWLQTKVRGRAGLACRRLYAGPVCDDSAAEAEYAATAVCYEIVLTCIIIVVLV